MEEVIDVIDIQLEKAQEQIYRKYVDSFCEQPQPADPQSDQIAISYKRDEYGRCIAKVQQSRPQ